MDFTRNAFNSPDVPCSTPEVVARQLPSVLGAREGLSQGCTAAVGGLRTGLGSKGSCILACSGFGTWDVDLDVDLGFELTCSARGDRQRG